MSNGKEDMTTKVCSKCNKEKLLTEFNKNSNLKINWIIDVENVII